MTVFVAIDTKTSSTLADARVIEIGIVRFELVLRDGNVQGDVLDVWETLVNPGADKITSAAQDIHGIAKRQLKNEPSFEEIIETLTDKLDGDVLVFHNSSLDKDRIASEYAKLGHSIPAGNNQIVDTKELAEKADLPTNINDLAIELNLTGETKRALPTAKLLSEVLTGLIRDHGIDLESLQKPRTKLTRLELQIISVEREEAWVLAAGRKFSPAQTEYLAKLRKRQAETV
jgi:DNA polymerase III epsilon subunit-like protein